MLSRFACTKQSISKRFAGCPKLTIQKSGQKSKTTIPSLKTNFLASSKPLLISGLALSPIALSELTPESFWHMLSSLPYTDPMVPVLFFIFFQAIMGIADNIYHHELTERLPWRVTAHREQLIHMSRGGLYSLVFLTLAGVTPTG